MFPRQIVCVFNFKGTGGGGSEFANKCLLPLNIIHDKVRKLVLMIRYEMLTLARSSW